MSSIRRTDNIRPCAGLQYLKGENMIIKNQIITAGITDITSEGSGVCRADGFAVFVPDTAVGDVAEIRIVKVLKSYAYGIVEKLLTPSHDRTAPECPMYKKCGGCIFQHISYEAECCIKSDIVRNAFQRIGGLSPEYDDFIAADSHSRYRNKAQYPLAVQDGKAVCGFYAKRSHRVVPVSDCRLQPEVFADIVSCSLDYINSHKLSVYDETTHTGILRHIYIRRGYHSGQIMVCFVARKDYSRQLTQLAHILHHEIENVCSVVMNINPDDTNVILGKKWVNLFGEDTITDTMCGNRILISPPSFYQVNTPQAEKVYAKALEYAAPAPDDILADLYCGMGTIGLSMADSVSSLVGVEIIPEAVEDAKQNAAANEIYNAEFHCGDAGKVFAKLRKDGCSPDIIVVDPPRKGCSAETLQVIVDPAPKKIVMISCNPSTAARDCKWLTENGYSLEKVCGADFFPRTAHVECVVLMSRNES